VLARKVVPGQLIHAEKHGLPAIPGEDAPRLIEAARFMDANESDHLISTARSAAGKSTDEILAASGHGFAAFARAAFEQFDGKGEF